MNSAVIIAILLKYIAQPFKDTNLLNVPNLIATRLLPLALKFFCATFKTLLQILVLPLILQLNFTMALSSSTHLAKLSIDTLM